MTTFKQYLQEGSNITAYHGTSESVGKKIQQDGKLQSRKDETGNWGGGPFGGNPSNPDLVYVTFDKNLAVDYARRVARKKDERAGAVITAKARKNDMVLDEDVTFEMLNSSDPQSSPQLWQAYGEYLRKWEGMDGMDREDAYELWSSDPFASDSQLSEQMIFFAEYISKNWPDLFEEMLKTSRSVGVEGPVPVESVEYIDL